MLEKSILVVDDEAPIRDSLSRRFERKFKNVYMAKSGTEALIFLKEQKIDLVISDYCMPGITGLELSTQVKNLDDRIPFILVTAMGDELPSQVDQCDQIVAKPFRAKELVELALDLVQK